MLAAGEFSDPNESMVDFIPLVAPNSVAFVNDVRMNIDEPKEGGKNDALVITSHRIFYIFVGTKKSAEVKNAFGLSTAQNTTGITIDWIIHRKQLVGKIDVKGIQGERPHQFIIRSVDSNSKQKTHTVTSSRNIVSLLLRTVVPSHK